MSELDLENLREAFTARAAPGHGCAPPERLFDAATWQLPHHEARALLAHNLHCPDCAAAWRLARELAEEAGLAPAPEAQPIRWRRIGAIAAGLAAAASLLLVPLARRSEAPPAQPVTRAQESTPIHALSNDSLGRSQFRLRWSGVPGARYTLTVTTRDLVRIHEVSGLQQPEAEVPAAALAQVPAGTTLVWMIQALLPDGGRYASQAFFVRVE